MNAQAYDNRIERKSAILDTTRPFVAVKPKGFLNPVIGYYDSMKAARAAAKRWNENKE